MEHARTRREALSAGEAARLLGVAPSTLSGYVKRGLIRPRQYVPNGWRRFDRDELEALRLGRREVESC